MKTKYIIVLLIFLASIILALFKNSSIKKSLRKIAKNRTDYSYDKFLNLFPEINSEILENTYYRLQDSIGAEWDNLFPIFPDDDILVLYKLDKEEVYELVTELADFFKIPFTNIEQFMGKRKNLTVRELVTFLASS